MKWETVIGIETHAQLSTRSKIFSGASTDFGAPPDAAGYAHDLYANLRRLDEAGCDAILAEALPETVEWAAIRDRLARASAAGLPPEAT